MARGWGEGEVGKGGQMYGDRGKLDFWWYARCSVESYQIIMWT